MIEASLRALRDGGDLLCGGEDRFFAAPATEEVLEMVAMAPMRSRRWIRCSTVSGFTSSDTAASVITAS